MAALVCVARDEDDPRSILISIDELHNVHVATDCGGRRQPLTRPTLAGYMDRDLIPPGVPFGHSGSHGPGPIKVLVQERHIDCATLDELRRRAAGAKLRRRYRVATVCAAA